MRTPSPYLPWNKVAGSALLLGVAAYLWAEGLGALKQLSRTTWQTDLAAFFAITALLVLWADRSLHSRPLRIAYLSLVTLGVAAAVAGSLRGSGLQAALPLGLTTVGLGVSSLLWQKNRTTWSWQGKVLWAFVLSALPSVLFAEPSLSGGRPPLILLALFLVLGVTLCLSDEASGNLSNRSGKRLAAISLVTFVLGWAVASLAPGASSAASWGVRSLAAAARALFLELVKPVAWLVDWLIRLLLIAIRKEPDPEAPIQMMPGKRPLPEVREYTTPKAFTVAGWILGVIAVAAFIRVLWILMERYAAKRDASRVTEERTSDWSAANAAKWAAAKAREVLEPVMRLISGRLAGRESHADPIVSIYAEFMEAAAESGFPRKPSQTPLEFSRAFASAVPGAAAQIGAISSCFTERFYSGRKASAGELAAMRENLKSLKESLALDREEQVT